MAKDKANLTDILLEAGTNELEIVVFSIADSYYGINVAKVREIIRASVDIVPVPDSHESIEGAINLRGKVIPVVNLAKHLNIDTTFDRQNSRIIISEFNYSIVGFMVSSVTRIHRLSWQQVEKPSDLVQSKGGYAVALIKLQDQILFLLDFEKIAADINPRAGIQRATDETDYDANKPAFDRSTKNILVVEDSTFVRDMILDHLIKAGYKTHVANNGEEAIEYLNGIVTAGNFRTVEDSVNLVITDIEMPQMDGLHLITRIKKENRMRKLPCIVFSSMISDELSLKCKQVGADGEITKPQIGDLVALVDKKIL